MVYLILKEMKAEIKFITLHLSLMKDWTSSHLLSTFCSRSCKQRTTMAGLVATQ